ncbi:hypothetical protein Bbelb_035270 [Branchiostoma belcheri]|nr:hypothetical protein Bbelb_035270 [Branchiostoma belcheri]
MHMKCAVFRTATQTHDESQKCDRALNFERKGQEALENAHRTEGVREALELVLDLAKAPSHLNHALLIPALRRLVSAAGCSRRTNQALKLQTIANNYYRLSFFPRTIKEWNELEPGVAMAGSLAQFKTGLARTSLLH